MQLKQEIIRINEDTATITKITRELQAELRGTWDEPYTKLHRKTIKVTKAPNEEDYEFVLLDMGNGKKAFSVF